MRQSTKAFKLTKNLVVNWVSRAPYKVSDIKESVKPSFICNRIYNQLDSYERFSIFYHHGLQKSEDN